MQFTHDNQPYGAVTFEVDRVTPVAELMAGQTRHPSGSGDYLFNRAEKGWLELSGIVTEGGVTSRLFHATSTRDLAGTRYTVQVPPDAYESGRYVSVAM